jgi:hypothetical protein
VHDEARPWDEGGSPPRTLDAASVLVAGQALVELVVLAWRSQLTVEARVALGFVVALQFLLVWRMRRRSAGAVLGLMLFELSAVLVAAGASGWPLAARTVLAVTAVATIGLLAASAHAFPAPTLPRP